VVAGGIVAGATVTAAVTKCSGVVMTVVVSGVGSIVVLGASVMKTVLLVAASNILIRGTDGILTPITGTSNHVVVVIVDVSVVVVIVTVRV